MKGRLLLVPLLALMGSGCVYEVRPSPAPEVTRPSAPLPLRVAVVGASDAGDPRAMKLAAVRAAQAGQDAPGAALVSALRAVGLFRSVQSAASGIGYDLVIQWTEKQDRTNRAFFPFFLPLCDPMLIGCLPIYPVTERFTAQVEAVVEGAKSYSETGEAKLHCTGCLGCSPASAGDALARAAAVGDAAAKVAAAMVGDAAFLKGLAQPAAPEPVELPRRRPRAEPPPEQPAEKPAQPAEQPWWKQ